MRLLIKFIRNCPKYISIANKSHIRRLAKVAAGTQVNNFIEQTLTGRFLVYLNNDKPTPITNTALVKNEDISNILHKNNLKNLTSFNAETIVGIFDLLSEKNFSNKGKFYHYINVLDSLCCRKLETLDIDETLKLLSSFVNIIPNRITDYQYYHVAIEKLLNNIEMLSKTNLIQLIFYISFAKNAVYSKAQMRKCLNCLNENIINSLTAEELCIICNATTKTSTKITKKLLLDKIRHYINDNLSILKDSALFITLIKTIRHNRYQNDDLLESISCTIFFNKTFTSYSFIAKCHILALFADYFYYDEKLFDMFTKECLEDLKNESNLKSNLEKPRTKDIKRLLWALSNVNYKNLDMNVVKDLLVPKIIERYEMGEFKNDPGSLIEIILYLWMMNYRAKELVPYAFTKENLLLIRGKLVVVFPYKFNIVFFFVAEKSLANHRLNLLCTCMYFEDRNYFKELNIQPIHLSDYNETAQLKKRPQLQRILENLKLLSHKDKINRFEVAINIPHLNILGIVGYENKIYKSVYIEVMDEFTSLKNVDETTPNGLMQLKLRILDGMEEGVIVVSIFDLKEFYKEICM